LFSAIVIDGILQQNGMVSFRDSLTPEQADSIRAYVVTLANDLKENPPPAFGGGQPPAPAPAPTPEPAPAEGELHE
jgi:hypothetical protein